MIPLWSGWLRNLCVKQFTVNTVHEVIILGHVVTIIIINSCKEINSLIKLNAPWNKTYQHKSVLDIKVLLYKLMRLLFKCLYRSHILQLSAKVCFPMGILIFQFVYKTHFFSRVFLPNAKLLQHGVNATAITTNSSFNLINKLKSFPQCSHALISLF